MPSVVRVWKARVLPMTAKASRTESMMILTVELYSPSFTRVVELVGYKATVMVVSFSLVELVLVLIARSMVEMVVASAIFTMVLFTMAMLVAVVTALA